MGRLVRGEAWWAAGGAPPGGHRHGRHDERTDHITINGRPVVLPICGVFEIADGRITAWREYYDLGPARAAYATE